MSNARQQFVRILTPRGSRCHAGAKSLAAALVALLCTVAAAEDAWQPVATIEAAARDFVAAQQTQAAGSNAIRPGPLDPRLKLARCAGPLEAAARDQARGKRRIVITVRCPGPSPWKVYVPVDVAITETVLVTRHNLSRGHRLTAADVVAAKRDVSRLSGGYLTASTPVDGQRLRRTLAAGSIVTPATLEVRTLIRRGQGVTLTVADGGLSISMAGKALMDGALDERIRVKNLSSQRVVEGFVRSPQSVEVMVR